MGRIEGRIEGPAEEIYTVGFTKERTVQRNNLSQYKI